MTNTIVDLNRQRQARRPVRTRYGTPTDALAGAMDELLALLNAADESLFVDAAQVRDAAGEVDRILAALYESYEVRRAEIAAAVEAMHLGPAQAR